MRSGWLCHRPSLGSKMATALQPSPSAVLPVRCPAISATSRRRYYFYLSIYPSIHLQISHSVAESLCLAVHQKASSHFHHSLPTAATRKITKKKFGKNRKSPCIENCLLAVPMAPDLAHGHLLTKNAAPRLHLRKWAGQHCPVGQRRLFPYSRLPSRALLRHLRPSSAHGCSFLAVFRLTSSMQLQCGCLLPYLRLSKVNEFLVPVPVQRTEGRASSRRRRRRRRRLSAHRPLAHTHLWCRQQHQTCMAGTHDLSANLPMCGLRHYIHRQRRHRNRNKRRMHSNRRLQYCAAFPRKGSSTAWHDPSRWRLPFRPPLPRSPFLFHLPAILVQRRACLWSTDTSSGPSIRTSVRRQHPASFLSPSPVQWLLTKSSSSHCARSA